MRQTAGVIRHFGGTPHFGGCVAAWLSRQRRLRTPRASRSFNVLILPLPSLSSASNKPCSSFSGSTFSWRSVMTRNSGGRNARLVRIGDAQATDAASSTDWHSNLRPTETSGQRAGEIDLSCVVHVYFVDDGLKLFLRRGATCGPASLPGLSGAPYFQWEEPALRSSPSTSGPPPIQRWRLCPLLLAQHGECVCFSPSITKAG